VFSSIRLSFGPFNRGLAFFESYYGFFPIHSVIYFIPDFLDYLLKDKSIVLLGGVILPYALCVSICDRIV